MMRFAQACFMRCAAPKKFKDDIAFARGIVKDLNNFTYTAEKHITIKGLDISPELDKAMSFWSTQNYDFGLHIGDMYRQVFTKFGGIREAAVALEQPALLIA